MGGRKTVPVSRVGEVTLVEVQEAGWMQYGGRKPLCFDWNQFPLPNHSSLIWSGLERSEELSPAGRGE